MSVTLRNEDALAVDLLLDGTITGAEGSAFSVAKSGRERVESAQRVLNLLETLPAIDPPSDLAARTIKFCTGSTAVDLAGAAALPAHGARTHA